MKDRKISIQQSTTSPNILRSSVTKSKISQHNSPLSSTGSSGVATSSNQYIESQYSGDKIYPCCIQKHSPISIHMNQHLPSNKSVESLGPKEFKPSSESDICDNAERTVIEECSQLNPKLDHKSLQDQYLPHEDISIQLSPEYSGICTNQNRDRSSCEWIHK
ncbi:hypothetical protein JTB14_035528 [Gonioctena quinquepunctata]|nr:hypothetical protein JTB14_035528 [Gonioctena quinquepunctata]